MDADRTDFVTGAEYESLPFLSKQQIDALMAWINIEKILQHDGCEI